MATAAVIVGSGIDVPSALAAADEAYCGALAAPL